MAGFEATASVTVEAPATKVWRALTDPDLIARYMFGSRVESDWQVGSPILWKGEFEGRPYEDRGEVLELEPERRLSVTHFSPMTGQEDVPENYHRVTYDLTSDGDVTLVRLTQDNSASEEEATQFSQNWQMMLDGLKQVAEEADG
jgi:uncharacterized protein YndB with AHSA1/START domain